MNALENPMTPHRGQMTRFSVLIVDTGQPGCDLVSEMIERMADFKPQVVSGEVVKMSSEHHAADIVVVDLATVTPDALEILVAIRANHGEIPIVVVSEALDDAHVRKLIKLRVHDWLRKPINLPELQAAIKSGIRNAKVSNNRVHAVISASGGAGGTTVAVSIADLIARKIGKNNSNVALFDLDFSLGSCGYLLNMSSNFNLDSIITNPGRIDSEFVNQIQQTHEHGFSVYSFKRREVVTNLNAYELVLRLLDAVTLQHSHTILDIPYYETDWRQDVLSAVNSITIVAELNLPSIKHTVDLLQFIKELPGAGRPVTVLLNKQKRSFFGGARIKASKLKELFGDTKFEYLPYDADTLDEAMDRGVAPSEVNSGGRFLSALTKYVSNVLLAVKVAV